LGNHEQAEENATAFLDRMESKRPMETKPREENIHALREKGEKCFARSTSATMVGAEDLVLNQEKTSTANKAGK